MPLRSDTPFDRPDPHSDRADPHTVAGDQLRATGLRSTPQRRAILAAFRGGDAEHLSADEVYARATVSLPDLGRGTVYATLAEFSEVGLLAAFGTPEPVRYEINTERHAHFRCRVCLRIFDVTKGPQGPAPFERHGHRVEALDLRAEGVCVECIDYEGSLESAIEEIRSAGLSAALEGLDVAVGELETPVGLLLVAATAEGLVRVAFPEHGDAEALRGRVGAASTLEAEANLADAVEQLQRYFDGDSVSFDCAIDWKATGPVEDLQAASEIPYGNVLSYHQLDTEDDVPGRARAYGANPIPIVTPCHRVSLGTQTPDDFVGGPERRTWLLEHEQSVLGQ